MKKQVAPFISFQTGHDKILGNLWIASEMKVNVTSQDIFLHVSLFTDFQSRSIAKLIDKVYPVVLYDGVNFSGDFLNL